LFLYNAKSWKKPFVFHSLKSVCQITSAKNSVAVVIWLTGNGIGKMRNVIWSISEAIIAHTIINLALTVGVS